MRMAKSLPDLLPQNIFLTGANGRLASCIRPHLQRTGRKVTGFSRDDNRRES